MIIMSLLLLLSLLFSVFSNFLIFTYNYINMAKLQCNYRFYKSDITSAIDHNDKLQDYDTYLSKLKTKCQEKLHTATVVCLSRIVYSIRITHLLVLKQIHNPLTLGIRISGQVIINLIQHWQVCQNRYLLYSYILHSLSSVASYSVAKGQKTMKLFFK